MLNVYKSHIAIMYKIDTLKMESLHILTNAVWSNWEYHDRLTLGYMYLCTFNFYDSIPNTWEVKISIYFKCQWPHFQNAPVHATKNISTWWMVSKQK